MSALEPSQASEPRMDFGPVSAHLKKQTEVPPDPGLHQAQWCPGEHRLSSHSRERKLSVCSRGSWLTGRALAQIKWLLRADPVFSRPTTVTRGHRVTRRTTRFRGVMGVSPDVPGLYFYVSEEEDKGGYKSAVSSETARASLHTQPLQVRCPQASAQVAPEA